MKNTLLLMCLLPLFSGCGKIKQSSELEIVLNNQTNNIVALSVSSISKKWNENRQLFANSNERDTCLFTYFRELDGYPGGEYDGAYPIFLSNAIFYCITDTTFIEWKSDLLSINYLFNDTTNIFSTVFKKTINLNNDYNNYSETIIIVPSDSLFSIMQKDYSMLEKFPEYYGN
jgi:hypothetical protein